MTFIAKQTRLLSVVFGFLVLLMGISPIGTGQAQTSGVVTGDLRRWHRVAVTFDGPQTNENAQTNPFTDYRLNVTFQHSSSGATYVVPGFYAADGNAANTGATNGRKWRVYFMPDRSGTWTYTASFRTGANIAVSSAAGTSAGFFDGATGSFNVLASNKALPDMRARGLLQYVGGHHLRFAGNQEYFLKMGANSPENFLAFDEFDGTYDTQGGVTGIHTPYPFLHSYDAHVAHWQAGDPTWQNGKGKGIIGAINYLASRGVNSIYFITYNLDGGDGHDTWPWRTPAERTRFDVSKLDQWEIVFSHMTQRGMQLHLLTQEYENNFALGTDGVSLERALYYRELVARFGHHPALQWNIGEENRNTTADQNAFAAAIRALDPYDHPIAVHSFNHLATNYSGSENQGDYYDSLLGSNVFEATSMQGAGSNYNAWTIQLRQQSAGAGRPWVIYGDEQGPVVLRDISNLTELIRDTLWGNLMGGGAGVEWYFGYQDAFGDLQTENFAMAESLWVTSNHTMNFIRQNVPFWQMTPNNGLSSNGVQVLANPGNVYLLFFRSGVPNNGGTLNVGGGSIVYDITWFDPRSGQTVTGTKTQVSGPNNVNIGLPPYETGREWAALVKQEVIIPPVANNDSGTVAPGGTLQINLLANDTDDQGLDPGSVVLKTQPSAGIAEINNGVLSYRAPNLISSGTVISFTYTVRDYAGAESNIATITITINGDPNIAKPVILGISGSLEESPVQPTFIWKHQLEQGDTHVPGSHYQIRIEKNGIVYYSIWKAAGEICASTTCAWQYGYDLNPMFDGAYVLRIGAYIPELQTTIYSADLTFDVLAVNFLVDPRQGRPEIRFNEVPHLDWIQLYIGRPGISYNRWHRLHGGDAPACTNGVCVIEPVFDAPGTQGPYQVWIQAWGSGVGYTSASGSGGLAAWTRLPDLSLPSTAPGNPSGLGVTNPSASNPEFQWVSGQNATWYEVLLAQPGDVWWVHRVGWYLASDIQCANPGQICKVSKAVLDGVLPDGEYIFYVRAWGPGGFNPAGFVEHTFIYSAGNGTGAPPRTLHTGR